MPKSRMLLRVLRAAHEPKLTQRQVAILAGLVPARYWQIEHGEGGDPNAEERQAIAAVLGVKVNDIAWPAVLKRRAS